MVLQLTQDLINTTLDQLGKGKMVDLSSDLREHVAMSHMMQKNRITYDSGKAITWNLNENNDGNAKNSGLYATDNTNVKDGSFTLTIPWRHTNTSCAWDEREMAMNSGSQQIVNYIALKKAQSMGGLAELMESNFWDGASSSTDNSTPFGLIGYWLAYNASSGLNGGDGNFGTIGGKSCDDHSRLNHYTGNYTNVSATDLISTLRDAIKLTKFKSPAGNKAMPKYANGERRAMYTTWDVERQIEDLLLANNDNLQGNLTKFAGKAMIYQVPFIEVPYLTENKATSDPVIGIDWKQFHTVALKGHFGKESPAKVKAGAHNVYENFIDFSYNFRCYDRRQGLFLVAKSDPLNS